MEQALGLVFTITVVLFSAIIHEIAHGAIALRLGDPTAKLAGRLTMNPLRHLDPFGSIILPAALALLGYTPFGWARPVPYNPYNFKDARKGSLAVGLAGPLTNFALAALFGAAIRLIVFFGYAEQVGGAVLATMFGIIIINAILGTFNLLPFPPLDGSKALFYLFPRLEPIFARFGPFALILLIYFFAGSVIEPILSYVLPLLISPETFDAIWPLVAPYRFLF